MDDQGARMPDLGQAAGRVGERIEQAKTMARHVGEQARSAATSAGATAQDLVQRARTQTGAATETLYRQGARAGAYLTRNVNEYPLTALLIAGTIGYLTAYLIHARRRGVS